MKLREGLKITGLSVVMACIYGILHDQVTAHFCPTYFTVFHPDLFHTKDPTLLAFGWGVAATWWVGLLCGVVLSIASLAGRFPPMRWRGIAKLQSQFLLGLLLCAFSSGLGAYAMRLGNLYLDRIGADLPAETERRLGATFVSHNTSYLLGFVGVIALALHIWFRRGAVAWLETSAGLNPGTGEHDLGRG